MIKELKALLKSYTLKVNRPILIKPTFNHDYELVDQFRKGKQIEIMINYLLYKSFYSVAIFRPMIMLNKNTCKIIYSGNEFHLKNQCETDPSNNVPIELIHYIIKASMNMFVNGGNYDIDLDNEDFNNQFLLIRNMLTPTKRLIIKPQINEFCPDLILDNIVIDIKTDKDSIGHTKYIQQTLLYYYLYNHVLSSKIEFSKDIILGQSIFSESIDSIGIYYWKYNRLYIYKVSDLINDEQDSKIKLLLNNINNGNLIFKGYFNE